MTNPVARKHKVELADYPHHRDIANRRLLAELTDFEIDVLEELVNGSLKITVAQLADALESSVAGLLPLLQKLEKVDLLKIEKDTLLINKEMRKYYCCELAKFHTSFEPDLHYLQSLLHKVPIHLLPHWYAIPRTSDNIFQSIVEKYFLTPRVYQKHLEELAIESPTLYRLFEALSRSHDFSLPATTVMEMFNLNYEGFQELLLLFEYHFGGCLCYKREGERWQEYVTFYHEWRQYQSFLRDCAPLTIVDEENIARCHSSDFGFIEDLHLLLSAIMEGKARESWFSLFPRRSSEELPAYLSQLLAVAIHLHFVSGTEDKPLLHRDDAALWMQKNRQDQASDIYCLLLTYVRHGWEEAIGCSERDFREVEKSLKRIAHSGWVYFRDFAKSSTAAIGRHQPVTLAQKGKKWRYSLPDYNEEEKKLLFKIIYIHFASVGLVSTGYHGEEPCFRVTPYGRMYLGD